MPVWVSGARAEDMGVRCPWDTVPDTSSMAPIFILGSIISWRSFARTQALDNKKRGR